MSPRLEIAMSANDALEAYAARGGGAVAPARHAAAFLLASQDVAARFNRAPPVPDLRRHRIDDARLLSRKPETAPPPTFRWLASAEDQGDLGEFVYETPGAHAYLASIRAPSGKSRLLAYYLEDPAPRMVVFWAGTLAEMQDRLAELRRRKPPLASLTAPHGTGPRYH